MKSYLDTCSDFSTVLACKRRETDQNCKRLRKTNFNMKQDLFNDLVTYMFLGEMGFIIELLSHSYVYYKVLQIVYY